MHACMHEYVCVRDTETKRDIFFYKNSTQVLNNHSNTHTYVHICTDIQRLGAKVPGANGPVFLGWMVLEVNGPGDEQDVGEQSGVNSPG